MVQIDVLECDERGQCNHCQGKLLTSGNKLGILFISEIGHRGNDFGNDFGTRKYGCDFFTDTMYITAVQHQLPTFQCHANRLKCICFRPQRPWKVGKIKTPGSFLFAAYWPSGELYLLKSATEVIWPRAKAQQNVLKWPLGEQEVVKSGKWNEMVEGRWLCSTGATWETVFQESYLAAIFGNASGSKFGI
jgi:hypothetical protein